MESKRGQAAMEFMITYGWAILAAMIVIGILAYFGIFSPGRISGDVVAISPPLYIQSSQVTSSPPQVTLEISNGAGFSLTITEVSIDGTGNNAGITCLNNVPLLMNQDTNSVITIPCTGTLVAGDSFSGDITIKYKKQSSNLEQAAKGSIKSIVQ